MQHPAYLGLPYQPPRTRRARRTAASTSWLSIDTHGNSASAASVPAACAALSGLARFRVTVT